jgi:isopentenyldiphosphate isomerase
MSKVIIVDENDKIIGFKDRNLVKQGDIYRVSALWIENFQGEVLLAQRSFNKTNGSGKWGPAAAGTVETDENYDLNIYKEAEEEIGLQGEVFLKAHKVRQTGKHNYFCQWYFLKIDKELDCFKIKKDEVENIKWLKKNDLERELKSNPDKFLVGISKTLNKFKKGNTKF